MNADEMVRNLRNVEQKHKDKHVFTGEINISMMAQDTADFIEAQQQEINLLIMEITELRESTQALKDYAENIEADKDAQVEKLRLMETVLKDARTALELLHHMNPEEFCFVFEVRCAIDALLGGKEDVPLS